MMFAEPDFPTDVGDEKSVDNKARAFETNWRQENNFAAEAPVISSAKLRKDMRLSFAED